MFKKVSVLGSVEALALVHRKISKRLQELHSTLTACV